MKPAWIATAVCLAASSSLAGENAWHVQPGVEITGYADSSDPFVAQPGVLVEPSPRSSLAATLDAARTTERGAFSGSLLGIGWDPASQDDRGIYLGARLRGTRNLSDGLRLSVTEDARYQRREAPGAVDFQRNEAALALSGPISSALEWSVRVSDRRRSVERNAPLDYARDTLDAAATFALAPRTQVRLGGGVQVFNTLTVDGVRALASGELLHVWSRGTLAVRAEWFSPGRERSGDPLASGVPPIAPPGSTPTPTPTPIDPGRNLTVGESTTSAPETQYNVVPELPADALLLEPLEDEDDWDFGQTRVAFAAHVSHRLAERWQASAYARYQHRAGANLLGPGQPHASENRLSLRASILFRVSPRLAFLLQGSHLRSDVSPPASDFTRTLGSLGLQLRF